jgi:predicted O-methyltransferase YrrM
VTRRTKDLLIAERQAHWGARKLLKVLARHHPKITNWPAPSTVVRMAHPLLEQAYLGYQSTFERIFLQRQERRVEGPLRLDDALFPNFLNAPWDILPTFRGPATRRLRLGRGMDHPRYGRFIYAFARTYRPQIVVEVGSYAGGTAVGWATALAENGSGRLISVDNDTYSQGTYPTITRGNLSKTPLPANRYEFRSGDSRQIIPKVAAELKGQVDTYLVDADHSYEGALADLENGLPMVKPGGFILVHDIDPRFRYLEQTAAHPQPVYEAMMDFIGTHKFEWCILKYIRRHLGVIRV